MDLSKPATKLSVHPQSAPEKNAKPAPLERFPHETQWCDSLWFQLFWADLTPTKTRFRSPLLKWYTISGSFFQLCFIVFYFGYKIHSFALHLTRHSAIGWLTGQGLAIVWGGQGAVIPTERARSGLESATSHHEARERWDHRYRERQDRLEADRAVNRSFDRCGIGTSSSAAAGPATRRCSWYKWILALGLDPWYSTRACAATGGIDGVDRPASPSRSPRRDRPTSPSRSPRRERAARGRDSRSPPRSPSSAPPPRPARTRSVVAAPKPVPSGTTRPSE